MHISQSFSRVPNAEKAVFRYCQTNDLGLAVANFIGCCDGSARARSSATNQWAWRSARVMPAAGKRSSTGRSGPVKMCCVVQNAIVTENIVAASRLVPRHQPDSLVASQQGHCLCNAFALSQGFTRDGVLKARENLRDHRSAQSVGWHQQLSLANCLAVCIPLSVWSSLGIELQSEADNEPGLCSLQEWR